METGSQADRATAAGAQYSLARILGIWALAAVPMGVLGWIVFPALVPDPGSDPIAAGVRRIALLTGGLIWLFVLSMIIVRQEEGDLRWTTIKRRLRLNAPRDPVTGGTRRGLWLWVVPFLVASVVFGKWSWLANGVLFGFYHVHQPWSIVESAIGGAFFFAYPSSRLRSTWMGVIVHSAQSVFFAFLVLGVVLGLA